MTLATAWLFLKNRWPQILALLLVPIIIGAFAIWMEKREAREAQQEQRQVDRGRQEVIIEQQERTLRNVEEANRADRNPTLDERKRVSDRWDRCAADPAACE
jgi:hypothetical protein